MNICHIFPCIVLMFLLVRPFLPGKTAAEALEKRRIICANGEVSQNDEECGPQQATLVTVKDKNMDNTEGFNHDEIKTRRTKEVPHSGQRQLRQLQQRRLSCYHYDAAGNRLNGQEECHDENSVCTQVASKPSWDDPETKKTDRLRTAGCSSANSGVLSQMDCNTDQCIGIKLLHDLAPDRLPNLYQCCCNSDNCNEAPMTRPTKAPAADKYTVLRCNSRSERVNDKLVVNWDFPLPPDGTQAHHARCRIPFQYGPPLFIKVKRIHGGCTKTTVNIFLRHDKIYMRSSSLTLSKDGTVSSLKCETCNNGYIEMAENKRENVPCPKPRRSFAFQMNITNNNDIRQYAQLRVNGVKPPDYPSFHEGSEVKIQIWIKLPGSPGLVSFETDPDLVDYEFVIVKKSDMDPKWMEGDNNVAWNKNTGTLTIKSWSQAKYGGAYTMTSGNKFGKHLRLYPTANL